MVASEQMEDTGGKVWGACDLVPSKGRVNYVVKRGRVVDSRVTAALQQGCFTAIGKKDWKIRWCRPGSAYSDFLADSCILHNATATRSSGSGKGAGGLYCDDRAPGYCGGASGWVGGAGGLEPGCRLILGPLKAKCTGMVAVAYSFICRA